MSRSRGSVGFVPPRGRLIAVRPERSHHERGSSNIEPDDPAGLLSLCSITCPDGAVQLSVGAVRAPPSSFPEGQAHPSGGLCLWVETAPARHLPRGLVLLFPERHRMGRG